MQSVWDDDLEYEENGSQDIHRARLLLDWNILKGEKLIMQLKEKNFS